MPQVVPATAPAAEPEPVAVLVEVQTRPEPIARPLEVTRPAATEAAPAPVARTEPRQPAIEPETIAVDTPPAQPKSAPPGERPTASARRQPQSASLPVTPPRTGDAPDQLEPHSAGIERANLLLRIGNVQGARSALADGVKARHPDSIAELARTYDPHEIKPFLVPPGTADVSKAIELYTEAAQLGSTAARTRLAKLKAGQAPSAVPPIRQP